MVAVDGVHVRDYERAAASMITGVAFRTVAGRGGVIGADVLSDLMSAADANPAQDLGAGL